MNPIDWSLSALDTIFSKRKAAPGEATCPGGTVMAGYVRDYWNNWQVLCMEPLLVEDVEDLFIFGFMIVGFLLIGLGFAFVDRKIGKTGKFTQQLSDNNNNKFVELSERTKGLEQRLERGVVHIADLNRDILVRITDVQKTVGGHQDQ